MARETTGEFSSKSSTDEAGERRLRIGTVGKPHGTGGEFTVFDPTKRSYLLDAGSAVRVGQVDLTIASRAGAEDRPVIALEGVGSRYAAERLRGEQITVALEQLDLERDEYLADDLVGMAVVDGDRKVGTVGDVLLLPSADVLEVLRDGAGPLLVPMIRDAIRSIDTERRRIDIDVAFLGEA